MSNFFSFYFAPFTYCLKTPVCAKELKIRCFRALYQDALIFFQGCDTVENREFTLRDLESSLGFINNWICDLEFINIPEFLFCHL